MRIEIIEGTVVNGHSVYVGQEVEVSDHDGKLLIGFGKARLAAVLPVGADDELETATDKRVEAAVEEAQHRTRLGRRVRP